MYQETHQVCLMRPCTAALRAQGTRRSSLIKQHIHYILRPNILYIVCETNIVLSPFGSKNKNVCWFARCSCNIQHTAPNRKFIHDARSSNRFVEKNSCKHVCTQTHHTPPPDNTLIHSTHTTSTVLLRNEQTQGCSF